MTVNKILVFVGAIACLSSCSPASLDPTGISSMAAFEQQRQQSIQQQQELTPMMEKGLADSYKYCKVYPNKPDCVQFLKSNPEQMQQAMQQRKQTLEQEKNRKTFNPGMLIPSL